MASECTRIGAVDADLKSWIMENITWPASYLTSCVAVVAYIGGVLGVNLRNM